MATTYCESLGSGFKSLLQLPFGANVSPKCVTQGASGSVLAHCGDHVWVGVLLGTNERDGITLVARDGCLSIRNMLPVYSQSLQLIHHLFSRVLLGPKGVSGGLHTVFDHIGHQA